MSLHKVVLLLGSNLGDRKKNIETALGAIEKEMGNIKKKSELLKTQPQEFVSDHYFYNIAVQIETLLSPKNMLHTIKQIEKKLGRKEDSTHTETYHDRTIDIDIVLFDNLIYHSDQLKIPHEKHLFQRDFSMKLIQQVVDLATDNL